MLGSPAIDGYYREVCKIMPVIARRGRPSFDLLDKLVDEPNICSFKEDGSEFYAVAAMRRYGQARWKFVTGEKLPSGGITRSGPLAAGRS